MRLQFNEKKATQAACRFLHLAGARMNYMKLIKLLYMLDRSALLEWGRPVTCDHFYSMKLGPVLSEVHDLITEMRLPGEDSFWASHISEPSRWEVELKGDAGRDSLSEAEEEIIDSVWRKYGGYEPFLLVELLHKTLPEWREVTSGRVPLPYRDILAAGNKSPEDISMIEGELESLASDYRVLAAH